MPRSQQPLDIHQQELVNVVHTAHRNLALARKTMVSERDRRIEIARIEADREFERVSETIRLDIADQITRHETALDEALIAAYEGKVPVRRIAIEGFGNRYDGGVVALLTKLRNDGRVGFRVGHQVNGHEANDPARGTVEFPKPIDVDALLNERTTVEEPQFESIGYIVLVEADERHGTPEFGAQGVRLTMDSRDPYFEQIRPNARPGTPNLRATTATIYMHPGNKALAALESSEVGTTYWDHPVARWLKDHPDEALKGYTAALDAAL